MGNLIRTYGGSGWEEEIPSILKKDMKSLTMGEGADSSDRQSLNLQQRVIQSGLDALAGVDAADIVSLFKGKCRTLYGVRPYKKILLKLFNVMIYGKLN